MYSATLGVAAYTLFASSLTTFLYLFRENIKKCVTSSHHLFTISDALSSIFAGIIFLVNQLNMDTTFMTENNSVNNVTKFNGDILDFLKYSNENERISENSVDCEFKHIIMHYGMFFIPFTNAFVSLLGYSLHYIVNIARLDGSYTESIKSIKQIVNEKIIDNEESMEAESSTGSSSRRDTRKRNQKSSERNQDSDLESIVSCNEIKTSTLHALKDINFNQSMKYDKMTFINVVIQWLLPMLITIILHFGDYSKLSEERMILKDDECIFTTNFPFDHCYPLDKQNQSVLLGISSNSTLHPEPDNNYIEATDTILGSTIHSEEIDNVVSNIYKLINTSLSMNENKNSSAFNTSDLWNITKFMENNVTYPENEFNDEWKLFHDLDGNVNRTGLESNTNVIYFKPEEILESETNLENSKFETDSMKILKEKNETNLEIDDQNNSEFETISINILNEKNKTSNSDSVNNKSDLSDKNSNSNDNNESVNMSNNHIFEDIIQKIKNGFQRVKVKDKMRLNRNMDVILSNKSQCLKNQCFISTNFLKIHLFILLFSVYFIPILVSTIINVCVNYKFKQIKDKIETNCFTLKILTNFNKKKSENKEMKVKSVSWFPENEEESQKMEEIGVERVSPMKIEIIKEDELLKNILKNLGTAEKFVNILKINLLLAICLWTPLFMEILFRAFFCMDIPNWLMDSSFLGAVSFGIIRNFLNINMIKILKADEKIKKDNSIHPSL